MGSNEEWASVASSLEDILGVIASASAGDLAARVALPPHARGDEPAVRFAIGLNGLLDQVAFRAEEARRQADRLRIVADAARAFSAAAQDDGELVDTIARRLSELGGARDVELRVHTLAWNGSERRLVLINDVTERLRAEHALRAAESRFAQLSDSGVIGIIVGTLDGEVIEVNETLAAVLGHSRAALLSGEVSWPDLTPPEWRDNDARARADLRSCGVARLREKEYVRSDGARAAVLIGSAMLESGEAVISFVLDVRNNQRLENAIAHLGEARASAETFRSFLEAAPDAVVIADPAGTIIRVNSQTERQFGYLRNELLGQSVHLLVPDLGPGDAGAHLELRGRRKDGSGFPVEVSVGRISTHTGDVFATAIRDVSERKKADEQRFRLAAIVEASDDAIIGKTLDGVITSWNEGAHRLFGYTADDMVGESIERLLPVDRADEEAMILKRLSEGEVARVDTLRLRRDGTAVRVSVASSPIRDATGKLVGASKVVRDITALAAANDAVEAANRELEAFSYSVAHDLRAPLRGMSGFAHLLLEKYESTLDAEGRDWLHEIVGGAGKMGRLIDALLSLARLTRVELHRERVDLTSLVRSVWAGLVTTDAARSAELSVAADLTAEMDPVLARVLFDNLLGNAWKFTSKVATARVEVGATEIDGARVYFVRDNGAGFDPAYAKKLFGAFQRLHRADDFPGTGIGLATVQRIVHRHGGRIWAEGLVGGGATFHFTSSR